MHVHEIINSKNNNNNLNNIVISNNDSNFIDFKALADSNVNIDKRRKNYRSFDTSLGKNGKNLTELDSIYSSAHLNSNFLVPSKIDSNSNQRLLNYKLNKLRTTVTLFASICPNCAKTFKSKKDGTESSWFKNHVKHQLCTKKNKRLDRLRDVQIETQSIDINQMPFSFSDDYFNEPVKFDDSNISINAAFMDDVDNSWLNSIETLEEKGKFTILHLNLNSVFNKIAHVFNILDMGKCDIIMLNEVKLDSNMPSKMFLHNDYDLIRRDRTASGGGIMIYVKKCYKIIEQVASTDFELIYFKIIINGISYKFISAYKPPDVGDNDFIEHLDTFIHSNNSNSNWFIIGDLNCDLLSDKGDRLKEFLNNNGFKNFVNAPTRETCNKHGHRRLRR